MWRGESLTERESLLEDFIIVSEETEKRTEDENEIKKRICEKEKAQALKMRKRAMETIGESKKQSAVDQEDDKGKEKKHRRTSGQCFVWLEEHVEKRRQMN